MKSSTCPLDPLPTSLVKTHITVLTHLTTTIINHSLQTGHVPPALKICHNHHCSTNPLLIQKTCPSTGPPPIFPSYRKCLRKQLTPTFKTTNSFNFSPVSALPTAQTALIRIKNDLLISSDGGSPFLLILLDLSVAFDTFDHDIVLNWLHRTTGLNDTALSWFKTYLTNRTEYWVPGSLDHSRSNPHTVTCGVPQGSALGPNLFILYFTLGQIISQQKKSFCCYADETQLYVNATAATPSSQSSPSKQLISCLEEIKVWMEHTFLQLNSHPGCHPSANQIIIHNQHHLLWLKHPPLINSHNSWCKNGLPAHL